MYAPAHSRIRSTGAPTADATRGGRRLARLAWAATLCAPFLLAACGGGDRQVPVYPVSGTVKLNGEPAEGAQVMLVAQGHELPKDLTPIAIVKPDGSFQVGFYGAADGAPVGKYKATVTWLKVVQSEGGSGRGPNVLPKEYAAADTSPVNVDVTSGSNAPVTIDIKVQ